MQIRDARQEQEDIHQLVMHAETKIMHRILVGDESCNRSYWETICGWGFGLSGQSGHPGKPFVAGHLAARSHKMLCEKCFPRIGYAEIALEE